MRCDLHTHSIYSDGTWTPREIVAEAARQNLVVALTDHNSVSGLPEFLAEAEKMGVTAVPGIEFSTDYQGRDIHIVALFVGEESYDAIRRYVSGGDARKEENNRLLAQRLRSAGYDISYEEIAAQTPDGRVNRANFGREMLRKGYVSSVADAFDRFLGEGKGFYEASKRPDSFETITFIRSLGAVAILAHPLLTFDEAQLLQFLPRAVDAGLQAMETRYTTYDDAKTALAQAIAARFGLLESGGSDFHGDAKPGNPMGHGKYGLQIPLQIYENLKKLR